jgi:hypothetical protein
MTKNRFPTYILEKIGFIGHFWSKKNFFGFSQKTPFLIFFEILNSACLSYLGRVILQNKPVIPNFLLFSITTSHKLVVGKVSNLQSPYFRKKSGLNLLKISKKQAI